MADRDFSEIAKLSERLSKDPKSRIFVQLADAYRKSNMLDEALDVITKGLQIHPQYALAYLIQGKCYFDRRQFNQAKDAIEKTLSFDKQNIMALKMLAQICESLRDETGLYAAYKDIVALDPTDTGAREKLEKLEGLQKKPPLYTVAMAREYERQANLPEALKIYEYLSALDTTDKTLLEKINELKQKIGKEEKKIVGEKVEGLQGTEEFFKSATTQAKPSPQPAGPEILNDLFAPEPAKPSAKPAPPVVEQTQPPTPKPAAPVVEQTPPSVVKSERTEETQEKVMNLADFLAAELAEKTEEIVLEPVSESATKIEEPVKTPQVKPEEKVTDQAQPPQEKTPPDLSDKEKPIPAPIEKEPAKPEPTAKPEITQPEPAKPEIQPEQPKKTKEEDFKSFQEWLSGLLK